MSLNHKIINWSKLQPLKKKYGDGECWSLVEDAIVQAGGIGSRSLTKNFDENSDYIWGTSVGIAALQPGDLVQFRNYRWTNNTTEKITYQDGSWETLPTGAYESRLHHSAIVDEALPGGTIHVLEQNVPKGKGVVRSKLRLKTIKKAKVTKKEMRRHNNKMEMVTVETHVNETVIGSVWAFRAKIK